jgi:hypothetical protein
MKTSEVIQAWKSVLSGRRPSLAIEIMRELSVALPRMLCLCSRATLFGGFRQSGRLLGRLNVVVSIDGKKEARSLNLDGTV